MTVRRAPLGENVVLGSGRVVEGGAETDAVDGVELLGDVGVDEVVAVDGDVLVIAAPEEAAAEADGPAAEPPDAPQAAIPSTAAEMPSAVDAARQTDADPVRCAMT